MLKIIAGKHRGRKLSFQKNKNIRPTKSMAREAIFSILDNMLKVNGQEFSDISILDLCCGSGAMSLEAISRGAKRALLVDNERASLKIAENNIKLLNEELAAQTLYADIRNLKNFDEKFDVIFIDPPYDMHIINKSLRNIIQNEILNYNGIIIFEIQNKTRVKIPKKLFIDNERSYGISKFVFLKMHMADT